MERRALLGQIGTVATIGLAGCTGNPDQDELINHYSEGYHTYQSAEEVGSSATEHGAEKQKQMRENAADLMEKAKSSFDDALQLAESDQTQTYCSQAKKKANLKQAVFTHLAAGEKTQALSDSRRASEFKVVEVSEVRAASSGLF